MLVLSRKFGETIHIGGEITLTIVGVSGDKVKIGIDAPRDLPVHRGEIARLIAMDGAPQSKSEAVDHVA